MDRTGAARIVWTAGAVVLAVVLFDVLLLAFAGVLFAVFLRTLSGALSKHTRLPAGWAVLIVLVVLAGATAAILWWVAPDIAREIDLLIADVPKLVEGVTASLESYAWGRWLLDQGGSATAWLTEPGTVRRATSLVGSTIGLVGAGLVILLAGIFIAAEPRPYREGVLRLVPVDRRGKARELLDDLGRVLRAWLLGKVIAMAVIFAVPSGPRAA
jgi:predicted PurR-regulated permease PerM